jgi:hypothetical protein
MYSQKRVWSLLLVALLLSLFGAASQASLPGPMPVAEAEEIQADPASEVFRVHLDIPNGSRTDYLRLYYYDTSSANSIAWITTYNGSGAATDLVEIKSSGNSGYGYKVSDYIGHTVDTSDRAYVLNWRPNQIGSSMRLCGLRVAYKQRIPFGWSNFRYVFVTGSALQPRNASTQWTYAGGGCAYVPPFQVYVPQVQR